MYDVYMRVWLIAENWAPRVGGIERYLMGIASHMQGHEVTVFAPLAPAPTFAQASPFAKASPFANASEDRSVGEQGKLNVIRKRFSWKPLRPSWLPLYLFLARKARQEKPDIIICGKALMEGRVARLLYKKYGIPYVVCTYGMEISTWKSRKRIRNQLASVLEDASAVLYINEQTKQELHELGVREDRMKAVYPGIDATSYTAPADSEEVLARLGIHTPYILTVARLVARKGLDDLIRAVAELTRQSGEPDVRLVIVGDGPERKPLETLAKKLGVGAKFLGAIPDDDVRALYSRADLFALTPKELPGDYEGFGIVYLEAALFGLPVVGTKTGGVAGAVQNGVTGILAEPNNPESIAQALATLITDKALAQQYGQAGKERVLQEFTWGNIMKRFTAILHSI